MKFLNDVRFDALWYLAVAEIKNEFYIIFRDTMKKRSLFGLWACDLNLTYKGRRTKTLEDYVDVDVFRW